MVLIGALAAGGGAFIAFLIPPPALFWMLEAIDQRWFSQPLLLVLPNGFLQACVVSTIAVASTATGDTEADTTSS